MRWHHHWWAHFIAPIREMNLSMHISRINHCYIVNRHRGLALSDDFDVPSGHQHLHTCWPRMEHSVVVGRTRLETSFSVEIMVTDTIELSDTSGIGLDVSISPWCKHFKGSSNKVVWATKNPHGVKLPVPPFRMTSSSASEYGLPSFGVHYPDNEQSRITCVGYALEDSLKSKVGWVCARHFQALVHAFRWNLYHAALTTSMYHCCTPSRLSRGRFVKE